MSRMAPWDPLRRILTCFFVLILASLFGVLAACGDDNQRTRNPVPVLASVSPNAAAVGGAGFTLTATGSGFVAGSTVNWNGAARTTTYVGSTQLTAAIPATDLAATGTAQITVVNPTPGGGTSTAVAFTIGNATPVATSLNPASVLAGSAAFDLTVNGSAFVTGATVQWNGAARTTTFVSSTELKAAIAAADVATAGTAQVTVVNPAPGGGTSVALAFTISAVAPVPAISSLDPPGVQAGSPGFDLVASGTGFVSGATVVWNGSDRVTTFLSSTQVRAAILASDVAAAGYLGVAVRNPAPGGGLSNVLNFLISPLPVPASPERITVAPDGSLPNGPSVNGGMDWEGRYVIFASKASNLVPGDTNDAWDIFVRDTCSYADTTCTPTTTRISVAPDGSQADGDSGVTAASPGNGLAVSFTGRYVVFVSAATNLVAGDTNGVDDVFVRDTCIMFSIPPGTACTPQTVRVSLRADGSQSNSPSSAPSIANDAGHVIFVSSDASMVEGDGNGVADVFMRDVCLGGGSGCTVGTRRISVAPGGSDANGASGEPSFTGRYVAFTSAATNLVANDSNGLVDVFMRDTCVGAEGDCTPATERISVGAGGAQADGASSEPRVGPAMAEYDGRYVAFVSSATNLVAGDTNGVADVFMRNTCRGLPGCVPSTERISVTGTGQQIVGAPSHSPGFLRWDGETIPFVTAANGVVPDDTNGFEDVYVRHVCHDRLDCAETTVRVSLGQGGVQGNADSYGPRMNHDPWGAYVVTFESDATNLLPGSVTTPYYGSIFKTTR